MVTFAGANGAVGRIALQLRFRRIYAELWWQVNEPGRDTRNRFLGEVCERSRAKNLEEGWRRAHAKGFAQPPCGMV